MFAIDVAELDVAETLAAVARVHAVKLAAEAELLGLAVHYADLCPGPDSIPAAESIPGSEQSKVYGGPGCPGIGDFAPAEFGVVTDRSAGAAARYLGQALALRHRLPLTWAQVQSGHAAAWKACTIATASAGLSLEAASIVDHRVFSIVDSVTPLRLANIVKAASWQADPDQARAEAEAKARERGVWAGRSDEHGTTTLFIRAATGEVIRLDATITQIAEALAAQGDTGTVDQRRARAVGVLADPELACKLLTVSQQLLATTTTSTSTGAAAVTPPVPAAEPGSVDERGQGGGQVSLASLTGTLASLRDSTGSADWTDSTDRADGSTPPRSPRLPRARTVLYVHVAEQTLATGEGVVRVEGYGPVLTSRLAEVLGHDQIIVRPVIDLNDTLSVDAYEIPDRIRQHVKLRYPVEQFPFGVATTTNSTDLDHVTAFDPTGPPGQTSTSNLVPLRRYSHRLKTHGNWKVRRLDADTLEWTTPHGYTLLVDHSGTHPPDEATVS
ncbi:DUF222 domain-containing protein [Kribbella italica]|uniref:DUF222 domain-containing protein n=1 Tax=Kribbella italica TaxID=1540520 RepID=A0A7W9JFA6_9ACTN|nr:DUF222 domain-containing protein [Kribbella italica]MBB5841084.1 hypothetical protein [Kribbella italica]